MMLLQGLEIAEITGLPGLENIIKNSATSKIHNKVNYQNSVQHSHMVYLLSWRVNAFSKMVLILHIKSMK